jgi:hypothetical protein
MMEQLDDKTDSHEDVARHGAGRHTACMNAFASARKRVTKPTVEKTGTTTNQRQHRQLQHQHQQKHLRQHNVRQPPRPPRPQQHCRLSLLGTST